MRWLRPWLWFKQLDQLKSWNKEVIKIATEPIRTADGAMNRYSDTPYENAERLWRVNFGRSC